MGYSPWGRKSQTRLSTATTEIRLPAELKIITPWPFTEVCQPLPGLVLTTSKPFIVRFWVVLHGFPRIFTYAMSSNPSNNEGLQKTVLSIWMRNQAQGSCLWTPARQQEPGPGQQTWVNLGLLSPQMPACGTTYCSASKCTGATGGRPGYRSWLCHVLCDLGQVIQAS